MTQLEFDENIGKQLEVLYRSRDVGRRRRLVRDALDPASGERILDIGCGPGFYVAEVLEAVGPSGSVVAVDASAQMLAMAQGRVEGHGNVRFHQADATDLPVDDADFDAALCVQVLEYVPNVDKALREMLRALRPGGRAAVWDVDWSTVSWHSSDAARMQRVLRAWDEHLVHTSLPRTLGARMRSVGFADVAFEGHVFSTDQLTPEAYGGAAVQLLAGFVPGRAGVGEQEAQAWEADLRELDERGEYFFSCVQFCFTGRKP